MDRINITSDNGVTFVKYIEKDLQEMYFDPRQITFTGSNGKVNKIALENIIGYERQNHPELTTLFRLADNLMHENLLNTLLAQVPEEKRVDTKGSINPVDIMLEVLSHYL